MAITTLKVTGMTCGHCVKAVTSALEGVEGVSGAKVDLQTGRAVVDFDGSRTTPAELASVVMDEGYMAEEDR
jgi:copper chaperone